MNYEVRLGRRADAYARRLDPATKQRIAARLDQIAVEPCGQHTKALTNAGGLRAAREGDYRIVFEVDDVARIVSVVAISPRGDAYRYI